MLRHLRLLGTFARVSVQNDAAYRLDFLLKVGFALLHLASELMGVWVIYSNTRALNGWGVWEALTLLGVYRAMVGAIRIFVAPNMRQTMEDIRTGTLDYVLLRPVGSQFLASCRRIVLLEVLDVVLGIGLAAFAAGRLTGRLPIERVALFILMLSLAIMMVYSVWLVLATLSFWFTKVANIEMVFWNVFEVARYPVAIYPPPLRWIFTYAVPVAFITSVPAQSFFGQVPLTAVLTACVLAPATMLAASMFWRYGVRHYSGASA